MPTRSIDPIDIERIRELRAEGHDYATIQRIVGVSHHTVWKAVTDRFHQKDGWVPTPDEIKTACRNIQSEWDAETERERRAVSPLSWEAPELHVEV